MTVSHPFIQITHFIAEFCASSIWILPPSLIPILPGANLLIVQILSAKIKINDAYIITSLCSNAKMTFCAVIPFYGPSCPTIPSVLLDNRVNAFFGSGGHSAFKNQTSKMNAENFNPVRVRGDCLVSQMTLYQ